MRSTVQRHQSPERPILRQISSLMHPKIQQRQVIVNVLQVMRPPRWLPPVLWSRFEDGLASICVLVHSCKVPEESETTGLRDIKTFIMHAQLCYLMLMPSPSVDSLWCLMLASQQPVACVDVQLQYVQQMCRFAGKCGQNCTTYCIVEQRHYIKVLRNPSRA